MRTLLRQLQRRIEAEGTSKGLNVVAFSGGCDSALVTSLVYSVFPRNSIACIGVSSSLPAVQLDLARKIAEHIGILLREVRTNEGSHPLYVANRGESCFYCKTHLYSSLEAVAAEAAGTGVTQTKNVLFNGTNKDDRSDPTRVGLKAAADFRVSSPIDSLTKSEVRQLASELKLPNARYAASPCLRSRLAFGVEATPEKLSKVEAAESIVKEVLGLGWTENLRVRLMAGNKALVEVDSTKLEEAVIALDTMRERLMNTLGFSAVDLRPFKSGSVSVLLHQGNRARE